MHFLPYWQSITSDAWVLDIIRRGYSIELIEQPPWSGIRPTKPPSAAIDTLTEEVDGLLRKGAVVPVSSARELEGHFSTYFIVPKKDGGLRPILNLKFFNRSVRKRKFKMETLKSIIAAVSPRQWLASIDLKDAYFHVPIAQCHHKYLRFHWLGQSFEFQVLPFGLSSAPRVFTKVLAPVIAHLRRHGVQVYAYLDDILLASDSLQEARQAVRLALDFLTQAGFILNLKKSDLVPSQDLVYIGGRFRTLLGQVFLPEKRLQALVSCARSFCQTGSYRTALQFLSMLGLMASTLAVVAHAHLHMRAIQWYVKDHWDLRDLSKTRLKHRLLIRPSLVQALQWWIEPANLAIGLPFTPPTPTATVTTDASMEGWGGHARFPGADPVLFSDLWSPEERLLHINVLELRAVVLMITRLQDQLQGRTVRIECDNTTTVAYINHQGGVHSRAQNLETMCLYSLVVPLGITLQAVHRPGVDNVLADFLSRTRPDPTEWSLDKVSTSRLFRMWGTPQVDSFASHLNHHLPVWFGRTHHQEAAASDALLQSWTGLYIYAFPPFALLQRVLLKIKGDHPEAVVLIAPTWPRRSWFHLLLQMACEVPLLLPLKLGLLSQILPQKGTLFHPDLKSLRLAAWKLSGVSSRVQAFRNQLSVRPWQPRASLLGSSTTTDGTHSVAGVVDGMLIPFGHL